MQENRIDPVKFARHLRRCQQPGEELLWQLLRDRRCQNTKFRRQHPIAPYTCDFFCHELSLAVECDGKDHFTEDGIIKDANRTQYLNGLGVTVIRFTNYQIENETPSVLNEIRNTIERLRIEKQNVTTNASLADTQRSKPSPPASLPKGKVGK